MASYQYKSQTGLSSRHEPPSSVSQHNPSSRLPTRSTTPISSSSHASGPSASSKLTKKRPEKGNVKVYGNAAAASSSSQRLAASAPGSSSNGALRRENTTGPESTQPNHRPPPTIARAPRFDAAYTRTPSLVSGSSASTLDSPRSVALRRKPSSIGRPTLRARTESSATQERSPMSKPKSGSPQDPYADAVLGIALPPVASTMGQIEEERHLPFQHGQELPHHLNTDDLPPPTPMYALSASPSTRYSESPGRFSHTSSPTSMSSHSPGVVFPSKLGPRTRQVSPTRSRPPVTRRKTEDAGTAIDFPGLPSLHESTTSSSSSSTVMAADYNKRQAKATAETSLSAASPLVREVTPMSSTVASPPDRPPRITVQTGISVPSTCEAPVYPPPELAHLADNRSPLPRSAVPRPARPSREGTPDLSGIQGPSPVVQSNLTSLPSRHRRQTSSGSITSPQSGNTTGRPSFSTSPNLSAGSTFSPVSAHVSTTGGTTPDLQSDGEKKPQGAPPSAPPSPIKPSSRFGFFSRRTKPEPAPPKKEKKLLRKGPMAGTGHEGYGKYGAGRGRSTSTTSVASSFGRSASADSVASSSAPRPSASRKGSLSNKNEPVIDGFLRDRLTPVVLRGEGNAAAAAAAAASASSVGTNSEGTQSASSLGSFRDRPGLDSCNNSTGSISQSAKPGADRNGPTLLPSAMSDAVWGTSPFRGAPGRHHRSDSSDSSLSVNLASSTMQRETAGAGGLHTQISTSNLNVDDYSEGKEGNWMKSKKKEGQSKPTRKWNFFQRAQSTPKPEPAPQQPLVQQMPPAVSPLPSRSLAHYAMEEREENIDLDKLERLMEEAERAAYESQGSRPPSLQGDSYQVKKRVESVLLPSPPIFNRPFGWPSRSASPKVLLRVPDLFVRENSAPEQVPPPAAVEAVNDTIVEDQGQDTPVARSPPRPSRLQQVGRIPQVISTRDRRRQLSQQSFSRPFVPRQQSPATNTPQMPEALAPRQEAPSAGAAAPAFDQGDALRPLFSELVTTPEERPYAAQEFFAFPPRKYSELSYTSSSGTSTLPLSTAVVPAPGAPPQEDEVWYEYDDLIDDVLSSPGSPATKKRKDSAVSRSRPQQKSRPKPAAMHQQEKPETNRAAEASARLEQRLEADISPKTSRPASNSGTTSVHLRRSRLLAAFQALATPTTAGSTSNFPSDDVDRGCSFVEPHAGRLSLPSIRLSLTSARPLSTRSSLPETVFEESVAQEDSLDAVKDGREKSGMHYRDSRLIEMAENNSDGLVSMANLRFGALMTSKWLSFGRVLFSPAHSEIKNNVEDRVLVLDGLGKDWSYYCALTYPSATVYYLNPTPTSTSSAQPGPFAPPQNYRHIHHADLLDPFPFPKGFFAAVVFRFPSAAPDAVYRAAISECKRVLRPGGYLEVSVLDLDMLNMGNRARRAVRELKMRMQTADGEVCLANASDAFQRLIGRRGFEGLSRCIVGVPAAGKIAKSIDMTDGAAGQANQAGPSNRNDDNNNGASARPTPNGDGLNFGDLLSKGRNDDDDDDDDGVSKMVARVGRWWYSRCYESLVLPNGDVSQKSIWADETLLRECEKRNTSFRLLICYAQKPMVTRRRTVSV